MAITSFLILCDVNHHFIPYLVNSKRLFTQLINIGYIVEPILNNLEIVIVVLLQ